MVDSEEHRYIRRIVVGEATNGQQEANSDENREIVHESIHMVVGEEEAVDNLRRSRLEVAVVHSSGVCEENVSIDFDEGKAAKSYGGE